MLAGVTRVGEWSHECHTAAWLDGATAAAPGVRFRGQNRSGWARWGRACTITVCDAPRELVYHTKGRLLGDSSEWRFVLEPALRGDLTRLAALAATQPEMQPAPGTVRSPRPKPGFLSLGRPKTPRASYHARSSPPV